MPVKLWMLALWGCMLAAGWGLAAEPLSPNDVWLYLPFEESCDALLPVDGLRRVAAAHGEPGYLPGLAGQGLQLGAERAQVTLSPGLPDFPLTDGSLVVWFRPDRPLGGSVWLLAGSWASFDITIQEQRVLAYATGNAQHFTVGELKEFAGQWSGAWHQFVMTWAGGERRLFLDGRTIGQRSDAAPLAVAPYGLSLGFLPQPNGRPSTAFLEGTLDDLAVLRRALTPEQVATLWTDAHRPGYTGLLESLGGTVLASLRRHAFVRGESAAVRLQPYAAGTGLRLSAEADGTSLPLAELSAAAQEWTLDTRRLRPGRYRLRAELRRDGLPPLVNADTRLTVLAERQADFPLGIDGLLGYGDATLAQASAWHLNHVSAGGYGAPSIYRDIDRLYQHGLAFFPSLNIHYHKAMSLPGDGWYDANGTFTAKLADEVLQVMVVAGDPTFTRASSSLASPCSPVAREAMHRRLADLLRAAGDHPGLQFLSFDDEYVLRMHRDQTSGRLLIGDYSPSARRLFAEQTGLPPVYPPGEPAGTIFPDDHPYLRWRDVIGMPHDATSAALENAWADLRETARRHRPDLLVTTWSGGGYGYLDAVMDYWYPTIWQPHPGYEMGHGRQDYVFDRHRATQHGTPLKPVWGLIGWWSDDLAGQPDWCVADFRLNTSMALAKGCRLITWFTAYGSRDPRTAGSGLLSRPDLRDEMVRWAAWIHRFGPLYARLEWQPARRLAVLWSEDNRAGQVHRGGSPLHPESLYPALRLAGFAPDVVSDRQVKAGSLAGYEALLLVRQEYASAGLWQAIERFAGTPGKQVFVDHGCVLRPAGAVELGLDAYRHADLAGRPWGLPIVLETMTSQAALVRPVLTGKVTADAAQVHDAPLVAPFWLHGGEARLLTVVNYDLFAPHAARVEVAATAGSVLYDLRSGQPAGPPATAGQPLNWPLDLAAGDSAAALVLPRPLGAPGIDFGITGERFRLLLESRDNAGRPLAAVLPYRVVFHSPGGEAIAPYERYLASGPDGRAELTFPRAPELDAAGRWTVVVTSLATGQETTHASVAP